MTLNREQEALVKRMVESGLYGSQEEVIDAALELLQKRDRMLEELRRDVREGLDQLERGEYTDYDEQGLKDLAERIKKRGLERLRTEGRQID